MKRYRFSLEQVLRARRAREDMARQEVARSNRRLLDAYSRYETARDRYGEMPIALGQVARDSFFDQRVRADLVAATVETARRGVDAAIVDAQRDAALWREAAQAVAVLERLDDRRRGEHLLEVLRHEAAEMDEIATARWSRDDPAQGGRDRNGGLGRESEDEREREEVSS